MLNKKELLKRGWTEQQIKQYLTKKDMIGKNGKTKGYDLAEVEEMEDKYAKKLTGVIAVKKHNEYLKKVSEELFTENPSLNYPYARKMRRHFIICVGGTNTGKTYTALEDLKTCEKGVYLGPLRLLAMEVQEKLCTDGHLCSLLTGEEEDIVPNAKFMSSTVEKLNINTYYDIGIIDECQMIADKDRGGSWTRAILGMCADKIYLCMAEDALDVCIQLIKLCNDTYEIVQCERKVPLSKTKNVNLNDLQRGDAIVLFSRKSVLEYGRWLENLGIKASLIYGALPYPTRKHQIDLYKNGQTDVIVTTDAIGMGLNLPIKRVLFAADSKFDGIMNRRLTPQEVKQIAGRAGRFGIYDEGYYSSFEGKVDVNLLTQLINAPSKQIKKIKVPFPEEFIDACGSVTKAIQTWKEIKYPDCYSKTDTTCLYLRANYLEKTYAKEIKDNILTVQDVYKLSTVMFDENNSPLHMMWKKYVKEYINKQPIDMPVSLNTGLEYCELYYKELDLYYSFCKNMNIAYKEDEYRQAKIKAVKQINNAILKEKHGATKKCNRCGKKLPPFYPFNICEDCYNTQRFYRGYYNNWEDEYY